MRVELGSKVKDVITGVTGIVTGFVTYLTGCDQYLVQPVTKDKTKKLESLWLDDARVKVLGKSRVKLEKDRVPDDGCDMEAPTK